MANTNKQPTMCYPTPEMHSDWKDHADELDMSLSEFIQNMVESGRKPFDVDVSPDETNQELRQQRNELKAELDKARERIAELEDRVYSREREDLEEYIEENPGEPFDSLVSHIQSTVPRRIVTHLEELQGQSIRRENDKFYPVSHE